MFMKAPPPIDDLIKITNEILQDKHPSAEFAFLSGSIMRGEGTLFSDLDVVVVYKNLPNAYRESFYFRGFPVETFVHTPETLNYFMFEVDRPNGFPALANMISEGIEVPAARAASQKLKRLAEKCLAMKPPPLSKVQIDNLRYQITNLIEDIRAPRSKIELTASGTELYAVLANFYFRANNLWSAENKSIPRVLNKTNPELREKFCASFEELFVEGKAERVIELTEKILQPHGGFLFEGLRLDAPAEWMKPS